MIHGNSSPPHALVIIYFINVIKILIAGEICMQQPVQCDVGHTSHTHIIKTHTLAQMCIMQTLVAVVKCEQRKEKHAHLQNGDLAVAAHARARSSSAALLISAAEQTGRRLHGRTKPS